MPMQVQYFFMTSLPPLGSLDEPSPMALADLVGRAGDLPEIRAAIAAVLLEHDLLARQAVTTGERDSIEPVVLTAAQARGDEPLPEALQVETGADSARRIGEDLLWEAYYRHVAAEGARLGCGFLSEWAAFEAALRNALVEARAKALNLAADDYKVAVELDRGAADTAAIVSAWSAADGPLEAQRALDQGRWDWLSRHGGWYSFELDEAAAYARGLVLIRRWQTLKASHAPTAP